MKQHCAPTVNKNALQWGYSEKATHLTVSGGYHWTPTVEQRQ